MFPSLTFQHSVFIQISFLKCKSTALLNCSQSRLPSSPPSDAGSAAWFSRAGSQTGGSENVKTNEGKVQAFRDVFWLPVVLAVRGDIW